MKVDYLPDLTDGGKYKQVVSEKLVRLYNFDYNGAMMFRQALLETVVGKQELLDLSSLSFVESINCKLIFDISEDDKGIETDDNFLLICRLTAVAYKQMIYMIDPFCDANHQGYGYQVYQWLYDCVDSDIDLLFSPDGHW